MNMFQTQRIRDDHKVSWQEEYIVGMVSQLGPMNAMRVLNICTKQDVMSQATAHKYLTLAAKKKLISRKRSNLDKREVEFDQAAKGVQFLEDIKLAYKMRGSK